MILLIVLALAVLATGYFVLLSYLADAELRQALANADRLDPGWRLADLEAKRARIPDEQNAALVVLNAARLLPRPWPPTGKNREADTKVVLFPTKQLDAEQMHDLRTALGPARDALNVSRKLAALPNGRYPISSGPDILAPRPAHVEQMKEVAELLSQDVLARAQEGDVDGALASCCAILNVGRSVGDESGFDPPLVRIGFRGTVTRRIERVLAQGEPSESALAALQRLLEQEEGEPLFLQGARGQRIAWERFFEALRSGTLAKNRFQQTFLPVAALSSRPAILDLTTRIVEIAKLPGEKQLQGLKEAGPFLAKRGKEFPWFAWLYVVPRVERITTDLARGQAYSQAQLRCAIAALAAERYRRAHGQWPLSLDALLPDSVAKVPADPFDGQPLRMCRSEDRVVIYSIGPDGQDCGGDLIRPGKPDAPGFRLWDEQQRRQ